MFDFIKMLLDKSYKLLYIMLVKKHRTNMDKSLEKIKPLLNLTEIGRRLGVSQQYMWLLFNGKRRSYKRFRQIQRILRQEIYDFLEYTNE